MLNVLLLINASRHLEIATSFFKSIHFVMTYFYNFQTLVENLYYKKRPQLSKAGLRVGGKIIKINKNK